MKYFQQKNHEHLQHHLEGRDEKKSLSLV